MMQVRAPALQGQMMRSKAPAHRIQSNAGEGTRAPIKRNQIELGFIFYRRYKI